MTQISRIRRDVFGMTQSAFAHAVGVSQGTVSRWERGMEPTREQLSRIRQSAISRGMLWNDAWFFEPPGGADGQPGRAA